MKKLDVAELRPKIDMDGLYVDFAVLRTGLSVANVARDSGVDLSSPTFEGECRGTCPKCKKEKSFTVNINTNRFNCFGKGCNLKGGGVIDFFSKLNEVSAKDASHLLAYAYGIQPYSSVPVAEENRKPKPNAQVNGNGVESPPGNRGAVTRAEFDDLNAGFERLCRIVWTYMLENDAPGGIAEEYDPPLTKHHVTQ
jgi:hypothetical protein